MLLGLAGLAGLPACERLRRDRAPREAAPFEDGFDVAIVGSGPAGTLLGRQLVASGLRTLILEAGASWREPREGGSSRLDMRARGIAYPVESTRHIGPGGTSNLWSGASNRLHPSDFEPGHPFAPGGWPLRYEELQPYYEAAEQALGVGGGEPTPFTPPRRRPLPPLAHEHDGSELCGLLASRELAFEPLPLSLDTEGDLGMRITSNHLPAFEDAPHAALARGWKATGVKTGKDGQVVGLEVRSTRKPPETVRARAYVLACGGLETPRLLLLSRSASFPRGVGNHSGQLGRYFTEHVAIELGSVRFPAGADARWPAEVEAVSWQFHQEFRRQGFGGLLLEAVAGTDGSFGLGAILEIEPQAENRVRLHTSRVDAFGQPELLLSVALSERDRQAWHAARALGERLLRRFGPPETGTGITSWCHHHVGTCRMGRDPAASVVDPDLRVHGTENLYVLGSAPFVAAGGGGPTLLLAALAFRLADHLAAALGARPAASAPTSTG